MPSIEVNSNIDPCSDGPKGQQPPQSDEDHRKRLVAELIRVLIKQEVTICDYRHMLTSICGELKTGPSLTFSDHDVVDEAIVDVLSAICNTEREPMGSLMSKLDLLTRAANIAKPIILLMLHMIAETVELTTIERWRFLEPLVDWLLMRVCEIDPNVFKAPHTDYEQLIDVLEMGHPFSLLLFQHGGCDAKNIVASCTVRKDNENQPLLLDDQSHQELDSKGNLFESLHM